MPLSTLTSVALFSINLAADSRDRHSCRLPTRAVTNCESSDGSGPLTVVAASRACGPLASQQTHPAIQHQHQSGCYSGSSCGPLMGVVTECEPAIQHQHQSRCNSGSSCGSLTDFLSSHLRELTLIRWRQFRSPKFSQQS